MDDGKSKMAISRLIETCARLAEVHPYVWKFAWEAVHRLPCLLPHDKSYSALRHFIAVRPRGLFLDIGANDGISVLSFRKFSKDYRILSLEPNPLLEPALKKIKSTDPYFDYRMVGAGSAPTRTHFFVPVYKSVVLHTFTSGNREQVRAAIAHSFGNSVAAATQVKMFEAEIIRLDNLSVDPAIIKIDAEGFDYDVLLGLTMTISRARPFIIIEIGPTEFDKIRSYLNDKNYALLAYDLGGDYFFSEIDASRATINAMAGHRNFFAVPQELVGAMPVRSKAR
jgi:FkbM family methyltransferase